MTLRAHSIQNIYSFFLMQAPGVRSTSEASASDLPGDEASGEEIMQYFFSLRHNHSCMNTFEYIVGPLGIFTGGTIEHVYQSCRIKPYDRTSPGRGLYFECSNLASMILEYIPFPKKPVVCVNGAKVVVCAEADVDHVLAQNVGNHQWTVAFALDPRLDSTHIVLPTYERIRMIVPLERLGDCCVRNLCDDDSDQPIDHLSCEMTFVPLFLFFLSCIILPLY